MIDVSQFARAERGEASPAGSGLFGFDVSLADCELLILGLPWELTVCYGRGTYRAPEAIIAASHQIDLFHGSYAHRVYRRGIRMQMFEHGVLGEARALRGVAEGVERVARVNELSEVFNDAVYEESKKFLGMGKKLAVVGGEHSAFFGYLRALCERHEQFGILHLDAHLDYRVAYQGYRYSHASVMYEVMHQFAEVKKIVHVGSRDFCEGELEFAKGLGDRDVIFHDRGGESPRIIPSRGGARGGESPSQIIDALPEKIYISFDIDALDRSLCPATGTPVPGGLGFYDVELLFENIVNSGKEVIGFDLSEVGARERESGKQVPTSEARERQKVCEARERESGKQVLTSEARERESGKQASWDANVAARILQRLCATVPRGF